MPGTSESSPPPPTLETGCEVPNFVQELGDLLWSHDGRFQVVQNMLTSALPVKLHPTGPTGAQMDASSMDQVQKD